LISWKVKWMLGLKRKARIKTSRTRSFTAQI
jgi:hypothetical protein